MVVNGSDILALLRVVGGDLPGAVQVVPEGESPTKDGAITWLSDTELADILRGLRADATAWIPDIALGGLAAKQLLHPDRDVDHRRGVGEVEVGGRRRPADQEGEVHVALS